MEGNGLSGGMFSGLGSGMLGLEMPLHPPQPPQQNPHQLHHQQHPQMVAFSLHQEIDNHNHPQTQHQSVKLHGNNYPFAPKSKQQQQQQQQLALSDEEDQAVGINGDDHGDGGGGGNNKRKVMSPWHRMKWTDSMVRLLIMAVFYIGDEACSEGTVTDAAAAAAAAASKKKTSGNGGGNGGGGLLQQKKGKWKSVSRAMMEKGFYVSPQQCEDKFNDLNKRYKRVNDILGKGTACNVVENQSLLDSMDNLSPKLKEEVRKLLNSKHLFFREMCAYHNSCGGGVGGAVVGGGATGPSQSHNQNQHQQQQQQQQQQQRCHHSPDNPSIPPHNSTRTDTEGSKMAKGGTSGVYGVDEDEEDDYDCEEEEDDEDEEDIVQGGLRGLGHNHNHHKHEDEYEDDDEENDERSSRRKRQRIKKGVKLQQPPSSSTSLPSPLIHQLSSELSSLIQDSSKSQLEKGLWMKTRLLQLEEHRVSYQLESFELEKQRLKWVKFSSIKEREMEREKIKNETKKLENERMVLLLRQKELELIELHQQQQLKRGSSISS